MDAAASNNCITGFTPANAERQLVFEEQLKSRISSGAFKNHLEQITREPHLAGTAANARVGEAIAAAMEKAGLDVQRYAYDVYLPDPDGQISVALVTPIRLPLNNQEYILKEDRFSGHPDLLPGFNAYSGSGDVTAEIVYANYGTKEDFEKLQELGIPVAGKIVIARFGQNFRGFKARYAEEHGAIGLIMYSDPADGGYVNGAEYPEGRHLNSSSIQRGSLLTLDYPGDPLTPLKPALTLDSGEPVQRLDPEDVDFPRIPVAPLPYGSAVEILKRMQGEVVPAGWQGGLPFTYRVTGGSGLTVRLAVDQPQGLKRATNIIGVLEGSEYPDEWVLLGCHYDAWNFGTADPNSGTAMLLTLANALGGMARDGWRPRRTIMIGHWDAEEPGILGSIEWVEQLREELTANGVAYINADMAVSGPDFGATASPSLKQPIVEAAQAVEYPKSEQSVYGQWCAKTESETPPLGNLGGGSDHMGFYMHIGIPSGEVAMSSPVPIYHSSYDNMAWYERFADTEFIYGPAVAAIDGILATRLANADILPYDVIHYAEDLAAHSKDLSERAERRGLAVDLTPFEETVTEFAGAAQRFGEARDRLAANGEIGEDLARAINQRLIGVEKAFIHPEGLQGRPWHRSLYASQDPFSGYAAWLLPGLRYEIEIGSEEGFGKWLAIYLAALQDLTQRIDDLSEQLDSAPSACVRSLSGPTASRL